ncbi:HAMP domain-containing sensor histidine kinase [Streptosporangium carneum]|uniref:histidine kinase n=1 Tax=Streptosporangium carneum TaxID=47481 RepID=A0A9W6MCP4_9ACTN|nr:HAMP domain-containing sensor histidine kinase [Streptosporangium carneum]GLK09669.1 two-component sensor histidine kinase [Streptosporangium carneum]
MARFWDGVGVRLRTAWVAVLVTAVVLVLGAVGGVFVLRRTLTDAMTDTLVTAARDLADQVSQSDERDLADLEWTLGLRTGVAQIVDARGAVVWGFPGRAPFTTSRPPPGGEAAVERAGGMLVAVQRADVDGTPYTVIVADSLQPVNLTTFTAVGLLAVAVPVSLLFVGGLTYRLSGRALAPVEGIRSQVASIGGGGGDLSARVPVPPTRDEVAGLATTMNQMLDRLESAQAAQRRFVADASHELRSPLTSVLGGLELAEQDGWRTDPETLRTMRAEAVRLRGLIDDLLLLARADERRTGAPREEVDLDDVVAQERSRLRRTSTLLVRARLVPVKVDGDRQALVRLVRNLVDNAARHARTTITLAVRPDGDTAVVEVADDGPGVPDGDRERIFDRFVRTDGARGREAGGAGLGLAIVAEIARRHHARIEVGDSPGGGALFRVRFPRHAE